MNYQELINKMKASSVKENFNILQNIGFCTGYDSGRYTERTEYQYMILDHVKNHSTGFQSDIADKGSYYKMSDKQAWCVCFEFDKLKGLIEENIAA